MKTMKSKNGEKFSERIYEGMRIELQILMSKIVINNNKEEPKQIRIRLGFKLLL